MTEKRCVGTNQDGTPCKRPPLKGSDRCHWHAATRAAEFVLATVEEPPEPPPAMLQRAAGEQGPGVRIILNWYCNLFAALQERLGPDGLFIPPLGSEPVLSFALDGITAKLPTAALVVWRSHRTEVFLGTRSVWGMAQPTEARLRMTLSARQAIREGEALDSQAAAEAADGGLATLALRDDTTDPYVGFLLWGGQLLVAASPTVPMRPTPIPDLPLPDLRILNLPPPAWKTLIKQPAAPDEPAVPVLIGDVPRDLAQVTCEEPRALVEAIANGRTGKGWEAACDGTLRVFRPRPNGHEVRLSVYNAADEWGTDELSRRLDMTLREWDLNAAFLAMVAVGTFADGTQRHAAGVVSGAVAPAAELWIDDLLKAIGKPCDSRQERNDARRWVRRRLLEISGAAVVGERHGKYRTPGTREEVDTAQNEALFHVLDSETTWEGGQAAFDGSAVPLRLRLVGGKLWQQIAQNPSMLQYIGNLRALADIRSGKAGGQWARAMGLTFAQLTREQVGQPRPRRSFTRRELLTRLPPDPTVEEVLKGSEPKRALAYWRDAKTELIRIGWWRDFPEPPKPDARYWGDLWLDQEVTPLPGPALSEPLPELAARAEEARLRARIRGQGKKRA